MLSRWDVTGDIKTPQDDIFSFIKEGRDIGDLTADYHDYPFQSPFDLVDMDKGVDRIKQGIEQDETICVYGDYDADGVTATALLYSYLENLGADVVYYIPSREGEGYGMNIDAVNSIADTGVTLIITVDNGISSLAEIDHAKTLGIDVVVTDHHKPGETLPKCCAVIDPHRVDCTSGFKLYAGVGIAFLVVCAIEGCEPPEMLEFFADLVAIGTISDVMPLVKDNRFIVKAGLEKIKEAHNTGISALVKAAKIDLKKLTATTVAFSISPRINAAGRIETADDALALLLCDDPDEGDILAEKLCSLNMARRDIEKDVYSQVLDMINGDNSYAKDKIIVVAGSGWHPGVVGISAARIAQKLGKPCVIISIDGELGHGSARTVGDFSIHTAFKKCESLLIKYGGHKKAAGLLIKTKDIGSFRKMINSATLDDEELVPYISVSAQISASAASLALAKELQLLEPCGSGNKTPKFLVSGLKVNSMVPIADGKCTRFSLVGDGKTFTAISFKTPFDQVSVKVGDSVDIVAIISPNEYRGSESVTISISDMRGSDFDYSAYYKDYLKFRAALEGDFSKAEELSRDQVAAVFTAIKSAGCVDTDSCELFTALAHELSYFKIMVALYVMVELEILLVVSKQQKTVYTIHTQRAKVSLDESKFFKSLRGE